MQFTMYHHAFVVLGVIVLAFIGAKKFKLNTELTLFVSAVAALLLMPVLPFPLRRSSVTLWKVPSLISMSA